MLPGYHNGLGHIALCGGSGKGKTTAAQILVDRFGYHVMSLATPLKEIARELFGLSEKDVYVFKDVTHPAIGATPRFILQYLGTEVFRTIFGSDVWIRSLAHRMSTLLVPVVVDDLRFPNELAFFLDNSFDAIRIESMHSRPPKDIAYESALLQPVQDSGYDGSRQATIAFVSRVIGAHFSKEEDENGSWDDKMVQVVDALNQIPFVHGDYGAWNHLRSEYPLSYPVKAQSSSQTNHVSEVPLQDNRIVSISNNATVEDLFNSLSRNRRLRSQAR